jgi:hypothetical protein
MENNEERKVNVGETVIYHDPVGTPFNALVTAVWTPTCINVVIVSDDESRTDSYGRQIERRTSLQHKSLVPVHGNYFRFQDEEPNPVVQAEAK